MKIPIFLAPPAAALALLLSSCSTTVTSRIENHPGKYDALPEDHKEAVLAGDLLRGMSKNAVFLSWGSPGGIREGDANGKSFEKWRYVGQREIVTTQIGGGFGHGYGHGYGRGYGRYGGRYCNSFHYGGPTYTYVPYTAAVVEFRNGKVVSWERER